MPRRAFLGLAAALLLVAGLTGSLMPEPEAGFLGAFELAQDDPHFGGMSALELSADGTAVTLLSDKGRFVQGTIHRNSLGTIAGASFGTLQELRGPDSAPLATGENDSEGLALAADGQAFVSFEGPAHLRAFPRRDQPSRLLPDAPEFASFEDNKSLEALAVDASGTLYTIPEASDGDIPVLRWQGGAWDIPFHIAKLGNFLPVGADVGPDGQLYLLERQFRGLSGFASRLRRFDLTSDDVTAGTVILETETGTHDNLEGVSVWRDGSGRLIATMVSDDNFLPLLRMELVEYHLPD